MGQQQLRIAEQPVSTVVESLPPEMRALFVEVVGVANPALLSELTTGDNASPTQRVAVHEILSSEFARCLQPDDEPTERGRRIDNLLRAFLLEWPVQGEWFGPFNGAGE